jgi:hypothetical protein
MTMSHSATTTCRSHVCDVALQLPKQLPSVHAACAAVAQMPGCCEQSIEVVDVVVDQAAGPGHDRQARRREQGSKTTHG